MQPLAVSGEVWTSSKEPCWADGITLVTPAGLRGAAARAGTGGTGVTRALQTLGLIPHLTAISLGRNYFCFHLPPHLPS